MGQKSDMEKAFGNKIRLLPKQLSDLNSATKYEGRIIIQESDDKIAPSLLTPCLSSYPCPMTLTLYSPFIFFMLPSVTTSASFTLLYLFTAHFANHL
jgi:hypothetical protein